MTDSVKTALCCVCGAIRQCRRPKNYRRENRWLRDPVDRDWQRETGELKCAECGRITTHAIITGDDHAEKIHDAANGWQFKCLEDNDHRRIMERYREGLPRNPYVHHLWWISDEEKARKAGESHLLAICRTEVPVPARTPEERESSTAADELVAPREYPDVDQEDPKTGLWWYDVDCTDCLKLANAIALEYQRRELKKHLAAVVEKVDKLDAPTVTALLKHFADTGSEVS